METLRQVISDWFSPGPSSCVHLSVRKRLLVFVLLVVVAYGVVWLVLSPLQNALTFLMAHSADFLSRSVRQPVRFWAEGREVYFEITRGRRFEAWLDTKPVFANLPVLLTLVLVTPGIRWGRRLCYVFGAGFLLFLTHIGFLYVKVQVVLIAAGHTAAGSPTIWQGLDDLFELTGKTFFPIFIWLLLAFPYMMGTVDVVRQKPPAALPRKALCPCGSGKKYKRCCGR